MGGFSQQYSSITPQQKRMLQSGGGGSSKRCVSEAKKICSSITTMEMCYVFKYFRCYI